MRLFKSLLSPVAAQSASPAPKRLTLDGVSERDAALLYTSAAIRNHGPGEIVFQVQEHRSFHIVLEGSVQVAAESGAHRSRAAIYSKGDCLGPLRKGPNVQYVVQSTDDSTVIEVTPASFALLSPNLQLWIYKRATESAGRVQSQTFCQNFESERKNALLTMFVENEFAKARSVVFSEFVQGFITRTPRMPAFAMDVAAKLLDETTSVKDVVESIKRDPSLAALLLKTVNSALFGFVHKIESFYHACTLLGFNNIYQLVLRDALRHVMPVSAETQRIHAHSCRISALCYETAMASGKVNAQTATTYGLLHDIGSGVVLLMKQEKPIAADFVSLLDTGKIGSDLLQHWGLPDRMCRVVELQRSPDFAAPELIEADVRPELAVLHLAHLFEKLLAGESLEPTTTIHSAEYMRLIGLVDTTPEEFFKTRLLPSLIRNKHRYAEEVRTAITSCEARGAGNKI